jgi:hypothetical protein
LINLSLSWLARRTASTYKRKRIKNKNKLFEHKTFQGKKGLPLYIPAHFYHPFSKTPTQV